VPQNGSLTRTNLGSSVCLNFDLNNLACYICANVSSVSPSLQIDGSEKKKKGSSFKVGKKKVKTKLSALGKAKAAQAMELDN
uniref:Uncharacterized protein n=1 Tax=Aegilops tauschii subsp. strangulata TaxID=200361 RepID=A0A453Q4W4_AEGTS